jgi:hypothetical protein
MGLAEKRFSLGHASLWLNTPGKIAETVVR